MFDVTALIKFVMTIFHFPIKLAVSVVPLILLYVNDLCYDRVFYTIIILLFIKFCPN